MTKQDQEDALANWNSLNEKLQSTKTTEEDCWKLLKSERAGPRRLQFMLRIYGRANKLRTERERKEIAADAAK